MPVDTTMTLGDLVVADPRRSRVLEGLDLDYCCHGHRTLSDAAREAGLDVEEVSLALDLPDASVAPQTTSADHPNTSLAHDIVDTHHAYLWAEMPRLQGLVEKVHSVHADRHPELTRVRDAYLEAVADLDPHMTREERILFPAISRLEKAQAPVELPFGSLANTIEQMLAEHDVVGALFAEIRSSTDGYAVPEGACGSYRAMLAGLREMEHDLHEHVHKENNILFPAVLEMERRIVGG